jgi:hypothetical protein
VRLRGDENLEVANDLTVSVAASLLAIAVVTSACAARRAEPRSEEAARPHRGQLLLEGLRRDDPAVNWTDVLEVDVDGDGVADAVLLGHAASRVFVSVVLATSRAPRFSFAFPAWVPAGLCGDPAAARVRVEVGRPDTRDPDAPTSSTPPGSQGFRLDAGDCDALHFFYDGTSVQWWRR